MEVIKKTVTFPRPGVGNYLLQAWVSFLHKWERGRRAVGPVAVFCALLVRSPKYVLWSLRWEVEESGQCGLVWWTTKSMYNGRGLHVGLPIRETWGCCFYLCLISSLNPKHVLQFPHFPICGTSLSKEIGCTRSLFLWYRLNILSRMLRPNVCLLATRVNGKTKQSVQFWRAFQLTMFVLFFGPFSSKALRHVLKVKACA